MASAFNTSALYKAIGNGNVTQVKSLLQSLSPGEIELINERGESFLHFAMLSNADMEIIQALIPKVRLAQRDIDGNNVMDLVLKNGLNIVYAQLISKQVMDVLRDPDCSSLARLVNGGWNAWPVIGPPAFMQFPDAGSYLSGNTDIDDRVREMHILAQEGNTRKLKQIKNAVDAADSPEKGFIGQVDSTGMTILHKAVLFEHISVIRMLADNHPQILQIKDNMGRTPLHYAAGLSDHGNVYELLKNKKGDETIQDNKGYGPQYYLKHKKKLHLKHLQELVDTLIRLPTIQKTMIELHKALVEGETYNLAIEEIISKKEYATICDATGMNALHKSVVFQNLPSVRQLSQLYPEALNTKDIWGRTPLHYAYAIAPKEDAESAAGYKPHVVAPDGDDASVVAGDILNVLKTDSKNEDTKDLFGKVPRDYSGEVKMVSKLHPKIHMLSVIHMYQTCLKHLHDLIINGKEAEDENNIPEEIEEILESVSEWKNILYDDEDEDADDEDNPPSPASSDRLLPLLLIHGPDGISALNKAIILQKHKLTEALSMFEELQDKEMQRESDHLGRTILHYAAITKPAGLDLDFNKLEESQNTKDVFGISVKEYLHGSTAPICLEDIKQRILLTNKNIVASLIKGQGTNKIVNKQNKSGRDSEIQGKMTDNKEKVTLKEVKLDPHAPAAGTTPSTPDSKYCAEILGSALASGLAEIAKLHPVDPIEYLAHYLYKYRVNIDRYWETQEFKQKLQEAISTAKIQKENRKALKDEKNKLVNGQKKNVSLELDTESNKIGALAKPPHLTSLPEEIEEDRSRDEMGRSDLHRAILGNGDVKAILMKGSTISARDNELLTPRQLALNKGLSEAVEEIDNHVISLFEQAKHGQIEKLVLDGYFEQLPDMADRLGVVDMREKIITSLQKAEAMQSKITTLFEALQDTKESTFQEIITSDSHLVSARNNAGMTPFQVAVEDGKIGIAEYLAQNFPAALKDKSSASQTYILKGMAMSPRIESAVKRSNLLVE